MTKGTGGAHFMTDRHQPIAVGGEHYRGYDISPCESSRDPATGYQITLRGMYGSVSRGLPSIQACREKIDRVIAQSSVRR